MKNLQRIQVTPDNSILIVIDIQKQVSLGLGGIPEPNPELSTKTAIIPAVRRLIDNAHEAGVPVIHVQSVRNHREPEFTVYEMDLSYPADLLKIGTRHSEFFDEVVPEPQDFIVRKWCHDPWYETDLERILDGLVADPTKCQAIITGGAITGCAGFGTAGFYVRYYQAVVVLDAVYGGPTVAASYFSRTSYPTFPNVYLTRSDMIEFSRVPETAISGLKPANSTGEGP